MMKTFLPQTILLLFATLAQASYFNLPLTNELLLTKSFLTESGCEVTNSFPGNDSLAVIFHVREHSRSHQTGFHIKTVVVDAGHGGKDGGCSGHNSVEKVIALKVAQKFRDALNREYPGVRVIMTRDADVFIPLHERAAIANRNDADIFISIHCNYIKNASGINGSETYVLGLHKAEANLDVAKRENEVIYLEEDYQKNYGLDPNSPGGHIILSAFQNVHLEQSILFAEFVEKYIDQQPDHRSRGVRQAGFFVLRETTMPSVLVETGYLSNANDEAFLLSSLGQDQIAQSLLNAFRDYKYFVETDEPVSEASMQTAGASISIPANNPPVASVKVAEPRSENAAIRTYEPVKGESKEIPSVKGLVPEPEPVVVAHKAEALPTVAEAPVEFRIQLAASKVPLDLNVSKWQNLDSRIRIVEEGGYLKYQMDQAKSWDDALQKQRHAKSSGFPDAFIVAYRGMEKISIQEAKTLSSRRP